MTKFHFGENLRRIRREKDINQNEIILSLNISQSTYSRIEAQECALDYHQVVNLANAIGVKPDELLSPFEELNHYTGHIVPKPKRFLDTRLGMMIIVGSSMAIIGAVFEYTWGVCDAIGLATHTRLFVQWTVVTITTVLLYFWVKRKKKFHGNIGRT